MSPRECFETFEINNFNPGTVKAFEQFRGMIEHLATG